MVLADADRIEQVITNVLSNALRYSPAHKEVRVHVASAPTTVRVSVRDEGPGLAPEDIKRIWNRFYRVKGITSISGAGGGLGLGLHISRGIIERHKGAIGVDSIPGSGSTFWFTLPTLSGEAPDGGLEAPGDDASEPVNTLGGERA